MTAKAQDLMEVFDKIKVASLRALFCDDLPGTADFIVFDRSQRGSNGAYDPCCVFE